MTSPNIELEGFKPSPNESTELHSDQPFFVGFSVFTKLAAFSDLEPKLRLLYAYDARLTKIGIDKMLERIFKIAEQTAAGEKISLRKLHGWQVENYQYQLLWAMQ